MKSSRIAATGLAATLVIFSGSLVAQQKEIAFDSAGDFLTMPADIHLGEVAGVATTSTGNLWVYHQGGGLNLTVGAARLHPAGGARLFEFDRSGKFVRELGSTNEERPYGFRWAQGVRVDPQGNAWTVDRGSRTIIKFAPDGRILMILGRTPEAIGKSAAAPVLVLVVAAAAAKGAVPLLVPVLVRLLRVVLLVRLRVRLRAVLRVRLRVVLRLVLQLVLLVPVLPAAAVVAVAAAAVERLAPVPPGDSFNQPTDVAWDAQGNIFVSDGYSNARVAKFDKTGRFDKSWGGTGSGPGQFNIPSSIAVDAQGNVYVADMGNQRIQVFDNNGTFKTEIKNVGSPRAICVSPGAQQFLYASNSNPTEDPFLNGEIYKMQLDGTIVGRIGRAGKQFKEFGMVNQIDCREANTLYVAELMNWRVQKLTLK